MREEAEGLPETDRTVAMGASFLGVRRARAHGDGRPVKSKGSGFRLGGQAGTRRAESQALRACGTQRTPRTREPENPRTREPENSRDPRTARTEEPQNLGTAAVELPGVISGQAEFRCRKGRRGQASHA
ncbi:hypothetical protein GCM10010300_35540 [Streptomyces olivaceoviridis]|nr:hypothetical protein GCM10010300_35540 [Streptomyces olivaceoviridis]